MVLVLLTSLNCYTSTLSHTLHSSSDTRMLKTQQYKHKSRGFCIFSHFGPHIWNSLPLVSTLRVSFCYCFIVTILVLVAIFVTARCSLTAFARKLAVSQNGLCMVNFYLSFSVSVCLLHAAGLLFFYCGASAGPLFCGRRLVYIVLVSPQPPWPRARARIRASFRARRLQNLHA